MHTASLNHVQQQRCAGLAFGHDVAKRWASHVALHYESRECSKCLRDGKGRRRSHAAKCNIVRDWPTRGDWKRQLARVWSRENVGVIPYALDHGSDGRLLAGGVFGFLAGHDADMSEPRPAGHDADIPVSCPACACGCGGGVAPSSKYSKPYHRKRVSRARGRARRLAGHETDIPNACSANERRTKRRTFRAGLERATKPRRSRRTSPSAAMRAVPGAERLQRLPRHDHRSEAEARLPAACDRPAEARHLQDAPFALDLAKKLRARFQGHLFDPDNLRGRTRRARLRRGRARRRAGAFGLRGARRRAPAQKSAGLGDKTDQTAQI